MSPTLLAVVILIIGGCAVIISDEWRLRLLALVFQYAAVALLFSFEVFPALGIIRLVAGAIAAMILLQSYRHSFGGNSQPGQEEAPSPSLLLRVSCVLFATVISLGLAQTYPLPGFSREVTIGAYWLLFSSVSSLVLSRDVSRIGFSLLMLELAAALLVGVMVETANLARLLLASLSSIILSLAVAFLVGLNHSATAASEVDS